MKCSLVVGFVAYLQLVAVAPNGESRQILANSARWNRQPGNPGVRIRLTKKGINHLKSVAVKVFNEQIRLMRGYSPRYPFSEGGISGHVSLQNVRVLHYRPPQFSVVNFLPPRYVVFGLENMDLQLAGSFDGAAPPFQVVGSLDGYVQGLTVALTAEFSTSLPTGLVDVRVSNCSTILQHSSFNIYPVGPTSGLVKAFEAQINNGIRRQIPNMFCRKLKTLIESNAPKLFAKLSKASIADNFKTSHLDVGLLQKFVADFVSGLYIDNRNIADPVVTNDYLETFMKGEVKYESGEYSTPFYPKPMPVPNSADRMLHFYGSDYLFNSLLYHAYQKNKLNIEVVAPLFEDAFTVARRKFAESLRALPIDVVSWGE